MTCVDSASNSGSKPLTSIDKNCKSCTKQQVFNCKLLTKNSIITKRKTIFVLFPSAFFQEKSLDLQGKQK